MWVTHLRKGNGRLEKLLTDGNVVCHPFVIGELACGNLKNRSQLLALLQTLPAATQAEHEEVMQFIENNRLMGRGLGYVDMHLLVSALITEVPLWTLDKNLNALATDFGIVFKKI